MEHDFLKSLAASHRAEDLPFWRDTYKKAFPTMRAMVNHREDGIHQRQGIDRSIILENSKQILIDEKVRFKPYNDIALEYLSSQESKTPGWVCKPLLADYIAYAIAPTGICYMLPVQQLQTAWVKHELEWTSKYRIARARNNYQGRTWTTLSACVPSDEVFRAIGQCLRISFKPINCEAQTNGQKTTGL